MAKSWEMILAEVLAIKPDDLMEESWKWFSMKVYASRESREDHENDLDTACARIDANKMDPDPLAMQQLRGWCAQNRLANEGLTPDELSSR